MVQIACAGCGPWGTNLLRVWNETPGAALVGVCRNDPGRLGELEGQYEAAARYGSFGDILTDEGIDAVSIATPPFTHYELARQAVLAGKHVFVEKPMCMNTRDATALAELADERERILMVGHLMEHHGPVRAIKGLIDEGAIGEVRHLHFQRLKLGRVRPEENVMWSFAPHDFSIAGFLLDETPTAIQAVGHAYLQPGIEEIVFVDALYEGGASAHVHVSWLHPETVRQVLIVGSEAMILWDDMAKSEKVKLAQKFIDADLNSVDGEAIAVPYEETQPLQAECANFVECIETSTRPVNDGWDGVRVVRMLEAATESMVSGCMTPL